MFGSLLNAVPLAADVSDAPGGAKPYEAALSIGVAVCLGVLTAPVVALGVYKGCREAMGPGVGSTEFETQVQVDEVTKGSSKI